MNSKITNWLSQNSFGNVVSKEPVSGGCINDSSRLIMDSGKSIFLKFNKEAPADMFMAESEGLNALSQRKALKTPAVIHTDQDFILLEDLGDGMPHRSYWKTLGEGLANMHDQSFKNFGFSSDNYCGATLQRNTTMVDGFEFFSNYRILNLTSKAFDTNLIERKDLKQLEYIAANLSHWIPDEKPVLLHGDLWRGNVHCDHNGNPVILDPAVYWGWAEAELAMTELFGGFDQQFYESYEYCSNIDGNWKERAPIYNLYHLLNHLILFGDSYLPQIRTNIRKFL